MPSGATRLAAALAALDPSGDAAGYCVALSGGLDSSVLLHACAGLRAGGAPIRLRAAHVDHGLQPESGAWADACQRLCADLEVPLTVVPLGLAPQPGASVEAEAREARYAALAALLGPREWLLTAHHRDDQLETVLIQLLRGAGVAGLAAMPRRARLGRGWHVRPLLGIDRAAIEDYARGQGLSWVRDPMNASTRFDRGWLRAEVLPAIRARWPAAATTVARSAAHLAEAQALLRLLAAADARDVVQGARMEVAALQRLAPERQVNLLRWWLQQCGLGPPSTARLGSAMRELLTARADAAPLVRWPGGELRRYRGRLYAMLPLPPLVALPESDATAMTELGPGLGRFGLSAGTAGGLRLPLPSAPVLGRRGGGEDLRPHPARPRKRLKDLCREAGIVPWMRPRLPLVFVGGRLVAVADLWIDAEFAAQPGEPALKPVWEGKPELD